MSTYGTEKKAYSRTTHHKGGIFAPKGTQVTGKVRTMSDKQLRQEHDFQSKNLAAKRLPQHLLVGAGVGALNAALMVNPSEYETLAPRHLGKGGLATLVGLGTALGVGGAYARKHEVEAEQLRRAARTPKQKARLKAHRKEARAFSHGAIGTLGGAALGGGLGYTTSPKVRGSEARKKYLKQNRKVRTIKGALMGGYLGGVGGVLTGTARNALNEPFNYGRYGRWSYDGGFGGGGSGSGYRSYGGYRSGGGGGGFRQGPSPMGKQKAWEALGGEGKAPKDLKSWKSLHRRQARANHPDLNPDDAGAEQRMKDINAAWDRMQGEGWFDKLGASPLDFFFLHLSRMR